MECYSEQTCALSWTANWRPTRRGACETTWPRAGAAGAGGRIAR